MKDDLPITMEDDDPMFTFEVIADYIITALAGIGLFASILFIAFIAGYLT